MVYCLGKAYMCYSTLYVNIASKLSSLPFLEKKFNSCSGFCGAAPVLGCRIRIKDRRVVWKTCWKTLKNLKELEGRPLQYLLVLNGFHQHEKGKTEAMKIGVEWIIQLPRFDWEHGRKEVSKSVAGKPHDDWKDGRTLLKGEMMRQPSPMFLLLIMTQNQTTCFTSYNVCEDHGDLGDSDNIFKQKRKINHV